MVYAFAQVCNLLSLPGMYLTNILKPEDRRQKKAILISCPIILRESSTVVKGAIIFFILVCPTKCYEHQRMFVKSQAKRIILTWLEDNRHCSN